MHAVIRRYSGQGASQLIDELARRTNEVEDILRGVPGFVGYTLMRTDNGGLSLTVCQDKAGTDESSQRAAAWVRENVAVAASNPPEVSEGEVILHLK